MKKKQETRLTKISADNIAKQLKRTLGLDKARKIAEYYNRTVGFHPKTNDPLITTEEVNGDYFTRKEILRNAHTWRHVYSILANQKGFTSIELLSCISLIGVVCVGCVAIFAIAHFISKFW